MKRLLCLLVPCLLLAGCAKDRAIDFPASTWALANWSNPQGHVMTLDFDGAGTMSVRDATSELPPFDKSETWTYQVTDDSVLAISYTQYAYSHYNEEDGGYGNKTTAYKLGLSMRNNGRTLLLAYQPQALFSQPDPIVYTFVRR